MSVEQAVLNNLKILPPAKQQEVLDFSEFLTQKIRSKGNRRILKGALAHLNQTVTDEDIKEARREMWGEYMNGDEK